MPRPIVALVVHGCCGREGDTFDISNVDLGVLWVFCIAIAFAVVVIDKRSSRQHWKESARPDFHMVLCC